MHKAIPLTALALLSATALSAAKPPAFTIDTRGVSGGTYTVDQNHTQVGWRINHMGFNDYFGLFGQITGSLSLNKADPSKSKVSITIPVSQLATSSDGLTKHMLSADFLNAPQFAEAKFESTHVMAKGQTAMIHGNLTLLGVTKPVMLDARLSGAGKNMMSSKETLGFHATTKIKRSEWGMSKYVPAVGDEVTLQISVAFEK